MLSQLFRRGEAQMGREEGGGEMALPLNTWHFHTMWNPVKAQLLALCPGFQPSFLPPPPLPGLEGVLSQLWASCWGGGVRPLPARGREG